MEKLIDMAIKRYGANCDLNFIDVSKVADMAHMFEYSEFNGDISKWDVSNVTNMNNMFSGTQLEKKGKLPKWYKE